MHPTILHEIAKAQIADMRRLAIQDAIARPASRGHRAQLRQRRHLAASLARRVITVPAAGGNCITARPRPRPGCTPPQPCHACT